MELILHNQGCDTWKGIQYEDYIDCWYDKKSYFLAINMTLSFKGPELKFYKTSIVLSENEALVICWKFIEKTIKTEILRLKKKQRDIQKFEPIKKRPK